LGTIADLAPLVGVNRRWLKKGLKQLPNSQLAGIQALMQVAGVSEEQKQLKPDDIGFKLGPRINAVGRIGDPQMAIELLTTDEPGIALERAMQCEQINSKRKSLCEEIEQEAIHLIKTTPIDYKKERVLVVIKHQWHHGVIGIVASRLVERYGVPVFIGTYEEEDVSKIRGSARGIQEFNVFESLVFCDDLLGKYGGHKAAGGFSLESENLTAFKERLSKFAHQCLEPHHLKPLVKIDGEANFKELNYDLYQHIDSLQPWGIENAFPVFWTPNVRILEQRNVGKNHLKLLLAQDDGQEMKAIAWRFGSYFPLPKQLDIAYKLTENHWNGNINIELDIVGMRLPSNPEINSHNTFEYQGKNYICHYSQQEKELRIRNSQGKVLCIRKGQRKGLLGINRQEAKEIDVTKQPYYDIIKEAMNVLNLTK
ncbi:MAG: DHHA1 domain-containing protein, partial [Crocosphaera sp.]